MSSAMTASKPRFEPVECRAIPLPARPVSRQHDPSAEAQCKVNVSTTSFYQERPAIFDGLRRISFVLDRSRLLQPASATAIFCYNKLRSTIEHRLLSLPSQRDFHVGTPQEWHVEESCRVATLIYINYVLREFHYSFALLKVLKRKLMDECEEHGRSGGDVTDEDELELLLWSLCMGAVLALDECEEDWFAERVAKAVVRMGLEGWLEVEVCLMRVLWVKRMSDMLHGKLWIKVEEQMERLRLC